MCSHFRHKPQVFEVTKMKDKKNKLVLAKSQKKGMWNLEKWNETVLKYIATHWTRLNLKFGDTNFWGPCAIGNLHLPIYGPVYAPTYHGPSFVHNIWKSLDDINIFFAGDTWSWGGYNIVQNLEKCIFFCVQTCVVHVKQGRIGILVGSVWLVNTAVAHNSSCCSYKHNTLFVLAAQQ